MRRGSVIICAAITSIVSVAVISGSARATGPGGWDHLGHGSTAASPALNGSVYALNTDDPGVLLVGGSFTNAGGIAGADHIARWTETGGWQAVGSAAGLNGGVNAIAYDSGKVYVGGNFTNAGGDPKADYLAVWTGTAWSSVCSSGTQLVTASVSALQIIDRTLYVGGSFADGGGITSADRLVACNLDTGTASSTVDTAPHEFNGAGVYALAKDSNGVLYAGGGFINLESIPAADHVAYLDGGVWHAMGSGGGSCGCAVDSIVRSLVARGTDVYVGTDSKDIAGIAKADNVAKWDGSSWHALGANSAATDGWFPTPSVISGLAADATHVYATGTFVNANGDPTADNVASFDGTSWHAIGSNGAGDGPLPQPGASITMYQGRLHVGGLFTAAGGDTMAQGIARYPGYVPTCNPVIANGGTGGIPLPIHLSCMDKNGIPVGFDIRSMPSHGGLSAVSSLGKVTYTPDVGYLGSDQFTYRGTNSDGVSDTKTVSIVVAQRGYAQAAENVDVNVKRLAATASGTVRFRVHNGNSFALKATSIRISPVGGGRTYAKGSKSVTITARHTKKLTAHMTAARLAQLRRHGTAKVKIVVKFTGPHGSHTTATARGKLHPPT